MAGVVLDACVLFTMYLRDTLLSIAEAGLYMPYWSQKILDEAISNLVTRGTISSEAAKRTEEAMKAAFPEAMVEEASDELEAALTNHPKDRHVLATAILAKADIIVSDDRRGFDKKALNSWNIKAQSPDNFLSDLFDINPDEIVQVVRRQTEKYKRSPRTFIELVNLLSKQLPNFTRKILLHEYGESIFHTTNKALEVVGRTDQAGNRYLEGEQYRICQNRGVLAITAKDGRGKILQFEYGKVEGKLTSADIEAFQILEQTLEQELGLVQKQKSQTL